MMSCRNLAKTIGPIDFMFHDAAHTGDDYIRDFSLIVDTLAPGAVLLVDDIGGKTQGFTTAQPIPTAAAGRSQETSGFVMRSRSTEKWGWHC